MKELAELTERLAKEIVKTENYRREVGKFLRELATEKVEQNKEILEEKIILQVKKLELDGIKIAGIDGGVVKKSLHGVDLRLSRAVGVVFSYSKNKLEKVEYHPSPFPTPIPNLIFDPYSELELELSCGMERQILEASIAREVAEKFKPEILLMHGSIIPHYTERPSIHSLIYSTYTRMIEAYKKLFEIALKNKILLAGVIEDSRGTRFCEILKEKIFPNFKIEREIGIFIERSRDTNVLNYALDEGERTFAFSYSSNPEEHPVLKEFGEIAKLFFSFYLKTAKFDKPIRVDTIANKVEDINKLSSVLLSLAGHSRYGMPSILIEADQRARLSEKDLEIFYNELIRKAGCVSSVFSLRREERPF
jgi:hypothetical protein